MWDQIQGDKGFHPLPPHMWWAWVMSQHPDVITETFKKFVDEWASNSSSVESTFTPPASSSFQSFLAGLNIYKQHTYQRPQKDTRTIWQRGSTKILDYGDEKNPPLLVVPSLVNQSYILDITPSKSLLRYLSDNGWRPLLVDWGTLSDTEMHFSIEDYINDRLQAFLNEFSQQIALLGYCMGGVFATVLAQQREDIKGLVLMATPWDFHTGREWIETTINVATPGLEAIISLHQQLPAEVIQTMFSLLSPRSMVRKFQQLAENPDVDEDFFAIEDWLNDCIPLAPKVARECLFGWFRDNLTHLGLWHINGSQVSPKKVKIPTLAIIPKRDIIVPSVSARALVDAIPKSKVIEPDLGHVGMIVSDATKDKVWVPIKKHLQTIWN